MKLDFTEKMKRRSDEELIDIVTINKSQFSDAAFEAALKEINFREIEIDYKEVLKENPPKSPKLYQGTKANFQQRIINFSIDFLAVITMAYIIINILDILNLIDKRSSGGMILLIIAFGYFFLLELFYQKTLGKFITKTIVLKENGDKPTLSELLTRTICRFIPFDPLSFLYAQYTPKGFHDTLSKTIVVVEKS
ncbi:MAG: RDD family protein [Saprospiraceae bacterium]|nr:RDD family protein [Saprospiraceae bacterium]